jgi:hypothetical protein
MAGFRQRKGKNLLGTGLFQNPGALVDRGAGIVKIIYEQNHPAKHRLGT